VSYISATDVLITNVGCSLMSDDEVICFCAGVNLRPV